jgi:hypothetical protein
MKRAKPHTKAAHVTAAITAELMAHDHFGAKAFACWGNKLHTADAAYALLADIGRACARSWDRARARNVDAEFYDFIDHAVGFIIEHHTIEPPIACEVAQCAEAAGDEVAPGA